MPWFMNSMGTVVTKTLVAFVKSWIMFRGPYSLHIALAFISASILWHYSTCILRQVSCSGGYFASCVELVLAPFSIQGQVVHSHVSGSSHTSSGPVLLSSMWCCSWRYTEDSLAGKGALAPQLSQFWATHVLQQLILYTTPHGSSFFNGSTVVEVTVP